jgi:succinate dehydrogenase/fumarate reductase flavoprotein subunit
MAQQTQANASILFDRHVDLLVVGAGAGGMSAALVASIEGMNVLLCEKSQQIGGTASTSAGTLWIPGNTLSREAGFSDTREDAQLYLDALMGNTPQNALRKVFLDKCNEAISYFAKKTDVQFVPCGRNPDYVTRLPGAGREGRAVIPAVFDGRFLKKNFARVRPPIPEMMIFKGMMVSKADVPHLLGRFKTWTSFVYTSKLFLRYATDLFRYSRGTRLVMGNALVARLYYSLLKRNVTLLFGAGIERLIMDGSAVVGAVVVTEEGRVRISARRGVVLATGGFAHHAAMREEFMPNAGRRLSFASEMNTGDGVSIGRQIGALVTKEQNETGAIWTPVSLTQRADGTQGMFPHFGIDRAKPGIIAVNKSGQRFLNEAISYHDFVLEMFRTESVTAEQPCYLVCEREFIRKYGLGVIRPGGGDVGRYVTNGYLLSAETISGLAAVIGVDADALKTTVDRYNGFVDKGVDTDFHKGETDFERFYGDPCNKPNPCLGGVLAAPYYALAIWPAETACTVGLATDADARVIDRNRKPITGLYACGNDMASIMDGKDPGPGATLGPAMVFGYLAARAAARQS